jgi:fluoride exporter
LNFKSLLLVGLGGAAGSILRFAVAKFALLHYGERLSAIAFPVATFGINTVGSFVIGLLFGLSVREANGISYDAMLLLATGFCGGFTTFSAFALENVNIIQKGASLTAISYSVLSVVCGLLLCKLGIWLTS